MKLLKVAIPLRKFEISVAFYRDVVGLPVSREGLGCCCFSAGNANIAVHVAREGSDFAPTGHGIYLDLAAWRFEQLKQRLAGAGVPIRKEWKDDSGHFIEVADPDGNLVELVG
jgi:catechol 2,3-dioxygenase-like lactoylglutathione lyase family enzyme